MRIASWNVLASAYCVSERYPSSPSGWDDPKTRTALVAEIVARLSAEVDVVCLQEVDEDIETAISEVLPTCSRILASHPHRRDATMVLTNLKPIGTEVMTAGRMRAASMDLRFGDAVIRVVAAHLEWSKDGGTGAQQLDELAATLQEGTSDHCIIGMDANGSWESPACQPLRQRGWTVAPSVDSARITGSGWLPLDVIAADAGTLTLLDGRSPQGIIPSLDWPSDHLVIMSEFRVGA